MKKRTLTSSVNTRHFFFAGATLRPSSLVSIRTASSVSTSSLEECKKTRTASTSTTTRTTHHLQQHRQQQHQQRRTFMAYRPPAPNYPIPLVFHNEVVALDTLPDKAPYKVSEHAAGLEGIGSCKDNLVEWTQSPKTVLLVKKPACEDASKAASEIASYLKTRHGIRTIIEPQSAHDLPHLPVYNPEHKDHLNRVIDLVVTVGGDGTILHVSSLFPKEVPPILSFSKGGTLGFLIPHTSAEYQKALDETCEGGFTVTHRMRLQSKVHHKDPLSGLPTQTQLASAMNEVVFQGDAARITLVDCYINDEFFTTVAGDGIIAATATGSTAYSLSCGGSMVHPALHSIILTPISPRSLFFRPIVLPPKVVVKFQLTNHETHARDHAQVWLDGRAAGTVSRKSVVEISTSPHPILTVNKCDSVSDWVRSVRAMIHFLGDLNKHPDPAE